MNEKIVFQTIPKLYIYVYSYWNDKFDTLKKELKERIKFVHNYPGLSLFDQYGMKNRTADNFKDWICVILDDQDAVLFDKNSNKDAEIIVNQIV